ncbi:MAG TPA: response regulator transcription factor, partial [Chloroflexota bacterium]|nr:response regulator transcription factor [Chloroflexota bacterium]
DDPKVLSLMKRGLSFAGYTPDVAGTGEEALAIARDRPPALVILDVMLPGMDGVEVCRRMRAGDRDLPILMLTARDRVPDRVAGLDAGADDYLIKPFAFDELLARIRALLRRTQQEEDKAPSLKFADLTVDPGSREVSRGRRQIELTSREYELLEFFVRHPKQVLTRDTIFEMVWGSDFLGGSNLIDVHVKRLRDKLEANGEDRLLHTIRGAGYSLREK